jgi:hypothetical protein
MARRSVQDILGHIDGCAEAMGGIENAHTGVVGSEEIPCGGRARLIARYYFTRIVSKEL